MQALAHRALLVTLGVFEKAAEHWLLISATQKLLLTRIMLGLKRDYRGVRCLIAALIYTTGILQLEAVLEVDWQDRRLEVGGLFPTLLLLFLLSRLGLRLDLQVWLQ